MMMLMMETSKYDDNTFRFEYIRLVGRVCGLVGILPSYMQIGVIVVISKFICLFSSHIQLGWN